MVTRDQRLAEFNTQDAPPPAEHVQVLCEDKSGTYLLPFVCVHADGQWRNAGLATSSRHGWSAGARNGRDDGFVEFHARKSSRPISK